ncbi:hypothetical protein [Hymenobacter psoromatis]|uniref:hypothetical protein n=1 Tax=Hymenobacter psoromatis TaxID=1484116 RepID=UPI001CBB17A2|nr:hypothetical protein [Hymenobacter psoromatis]
MRVLQYGFFGEDIAQREFLAAYLQCYETPDGSTLFDSVAYFGKQFGPMNNKVVDRRCADACREAFVLGYPIVDWLFIGRDVDSFEFAYHEKRAAELRAKIPVQWHNRTVLMLPMQCAEHWLLYLAQYPSNEPLERKPNSQAKDAVYADAAKTKETIRKELLATLTVARVNWMAEVSVSFRAFHEQVQQFLTRLPVE